MSEKVKEIIPSCITFLKERTDLLRTNSAKLLARFAKLDDNNLDFVRKLHGMEVLLSVAGGLGIK